MPEETNPSNPNVPAQDGPLTQALVEQLADKVMALLMEDLRSEAERCRRPSNQPWSSGGISGAAGGL
jgi:hypothetical protein